MLNSVRLTGFEHIPQEGPLSPGFISMSQPSRSSICPKSECPKCMSFACPERIQRLANSYPKQCMLSSCDKGTENLNIEIHFH